MAAFALLRPFPAPKNIDIIKWINYHAVMSEPETFFTSWDDYLAYRQQHDSALEQLSRIESFNPNRKHRSVMKDNDRKEYHALIQFQKARSFTQREYDAYIHQHYCQASPWHCPEKSAVELKEDSFQEEVFCHRHAKALGFLSPEIKAYASHRQVQLTVLRNIANPGHPRLRLNETYHAVHITPDIGGMSIKDITQDKSISAEKRKAVRQQAFYTAYVTGCVYANPDSPNMDNMKVTDLEQETPRKFYTFDYEYAQPEALGLESLEKRLFLYYREEYKDAEWPDVRAMLYDTQDMLEQNIGDITPSRREVYERNIQAAIDHTHNIERGYSKLQQMLPQI